jgi:hypothetical protein
MGRKRRNGAREYCTGEERGEGENRERGVESILREYNLFCPMVANVQSVESA